MLKKIISCVLSFILAVLGVFTGTFGCRNVKAAEINWKEIFTVTELGGNYQFGYKSEWVETLKKQLGDAANELIFPDEYEMGRTLEEIIAQDYGMTVEAVLEQFGVSSKEELLEQYSEYFPVDSKKLNVELQSGLLTNSADTYKSSLSGITSITFNKQTHMLSNGDLFRFPDVETITIDSTGKVILGNSIAFHNQASKADDKSTYASKLKTVYIKSDQIESINANAFAYINDQVTVYVTSQDIADEILEATQGGDAPLSDDQFELINDERDDSSIEIACDDINLGTEGGFAPRVVNRTGDEKAEINYTLYVNEQCRDKYKDEQGENKTDISSRPYNSSILDAGTYYLRALMKGTTTHKPAYSNVVTVKVIANENVNKTALDAAIAEADKFYEDNRYQSSNYKKEDWDKVFNSPGVLSRAKDISKDTEKKYSQEQVDTATNNLTTALNTLKNSKADNTAAWNELQAEITKAEAYLSKKDEYTEESWNRVNPQSRIDNAKALKKDEATVSQINTQISLLKNIGSALELKPVEPNVKPGDPFAFIPKKGAEVKVLSMTAPENLAGATKVRVTFKCADDTSFNEYASIDLNPVIAGTENYLQIKGTGTYETGATYTVDVPLSAAINAGDSIELRMATFSWDDAADWVYAVTAVEFVDADDKLLGSYIDKDVFKANLAAAIKEVEDMNTSTYTDESVKKLTEALEAAKALGEDATAEQMSKAIEAINAAIKGLEKKDDDTEAREKLTAAVKEAEGIDTSLYTTESVEKLTKALEAAKALKDDATAEEIDKVTEAINAAIKGLVKKDGSGSNDPGKDDPSNETKVIGVAKGKTFRAGNFNYKVSVAATITGTAKTAGKVTVVGLSAAGKKKSTVSIKNTISASGASYQVTGIGSKVFQKSKKLKKVTLGTNINSIPANAFVGCKKLTTVKVTGVTKIGKNAFKGCKVLKKMTFGKKNLSSVKKGAFKGCKKTIKVAGGSKKVKKGNIKKLKKSGYKKFK